MEIKQGMFTPLVFTTTVGMADKCVKYHSRHAELIANKKGESYSSAISWMLKYLSPSYALQYSKGGTWVFFGWVCAAQDSNLAPRSKVDFL